MSHSLIHIWIHGIFSTKDKQPLIHSKIEKKLYFHLKAHLETHLSCKVRVINGTENHVHVLFLLGQNHSIQEIFKNLKGESSHWVNQQDLLTRKFAWQVGYSAFSVSESMVETVERYIKNQKNHHKKWSFSEECALFFKKIQMNQVNR
ncbi:MAG: transposase [Calditrichaeota bacterium]|nr:transposase [Calditrichota bacterium]